MVEQEEATSTEAAAESPRFLTATDRLYQFFHKTGMASGKISEAAQDLDFALELGDEVAKHAAVRLAVAIEEADVPQEILDIYQELYSDELAAIEETN